MNKIINDIYVAASLLIALLAFQSCSMETPFNTEDGVLKMRFAINTEVTRAEMSQDELADNCVVYISNEKGLVFKEKGLGNLPDEITLRQGNYIAEAWTGDSVPASFDAKFYRCYEPIQIFPGTNEIDLVCRIANVVASVNAGSIDDELVKNIRVSASTSNGTLVFASSVGESDGENVADLKTAKGYFMMPYDDEGNRESELKITVEGDNMLDEHFSKEKIVEKVKPGFEYIVNVSYDDTGSGPQGGGFLTLTIDEREILIAETVEIFAAPLIEGVEFDIDKQQYAEPGQFGSDLNVKIVAFNEITSFTIECKDMESLNLPAQTIDLKTATPQITADLNGVGITWDKTVEDVENDKDGNTRQLSYIHFTKEYLNNLPARATEYQIVLTATDGTGNEELNLPGKTTTKTLRIAVGADAIIHEDPLEFADAVDPNNLRAIGARSATLKATVNDDTATGLGIQYREVGTTEWTKVPLSGSRAEQLVSVTIKNLKPGTTYEYKAYADDFEASESKRFTTESIFSIPNASMEDWSTYSASTMLGTKTVILPGAGGDKTTSYWGSGNEGAATASKVVLDKYSDIKNSGSYSARLASTSAVGVIAAGNIFTGYYVKTDGTNGVLSLGREYNASHPSKVKVYANYRPGGDAKVKSGNEKYVKGLTNGGTDLGQIYIALTTEPIEIRTNPSNRNLFPSGRENEDGDPHDDYSKVIAYGEVTWDKNFGPDGGLESVEIPFVYTDLARTQAPKYLVIVASASKYGDFFCGSENSVMILDDFELVYE